MTTAIYIRVSTDHQDPDRQFSEIRDYLGDDAFDAAEVYADRGVSGAVDQRDDFQRLWGDVESGKIDRVVTWEVSRLSRRLSTVAEFLELCAETETALKTLNDMFPELRGGGKDDVWDRLMAKLAGWMMEFELEMTRERIKSGVERARQEGKWVGQPPYGFGIDGDGYLFVEDPDELVRMQEAMADALTSPDESINSIANKWRVPDSSLRRYLDDEDRRSLYLWGETTDDRIEAALADSRLADAPEDRVGKLESMIEDLRGDRDDRD